MIHFIANHSVDASSGCIINDRPFNMVNSRPAHAYAGDRIIIKDLAFLMRIATYNLSIPEDYLYTYAYEPEQNWSSYNHDYSESLEPFTCYEFTEECYFRVILHKTDGNWCVESDSQRIHEILEFHSVDFDSSSQFDQFNEEIKDTTLKAFRCSSDGKSLIFALLSDSHVTVNGFWNTTIKNISKLHSAVNLDGIIHLGDLQDGLLDKYQCCAISSRCITDMRKIVNPVYIAIGNHDTNYFHGNPEWLTEEEQYTLFGRYIDNYPNTYREGTNSFYYVDYPHQRLRMVFLSSFNHKELLRYGFPMYEINWVKKTLECTPSGYKVLFFSHDAPLAPLDYWASDIRNGNQLCDVIDSWNISHRGSVMGYIHGHTHADFIFRERSFPIISIGCSKVEYFPDKKPEGSTREKRMLNTVTQELWDTLVITPERNRLSLIRFGAGEDRMIYSKKPLVWAHRGASGYAPENTLESFKLAMDLGADGVELDVQLTKDNQIVVCHDEYIERVSNGFGRIADYTLDELKTFNFNKTHPEYIDFASIPTLEEVLDLLYPSKMTINIELKTGVLFYEGIEMRVVDLVSRKGWKDRVIYSSFNHQSAKKVLEYDSSAKIGFLFSNNLTNVATYCENGGASAAHPSLQNTLYEKEYIECNSKGIDVNVYTVDEEADIRRLIALNVNAIITNYPDKTKAIIDSCY